MKKLLVFTVLILMAQLSFAQEDKSKRPSPPAQAKQTVGGKTITIDYSQPSVKGRNVWDPAGNLAPFGKVWRTGANEPTTLEVSSDVKVEGKPLAKGKYALFTIPGEKDWTIIVSKGIEGGASKYKQEEDVVRVTVPAKKAKSFQEKFTFDISSKGVVSLLWADTKVDFSVK